VTVCHRLVTFLAGSYEVLHHQCTTMLLPAWLANAVIPMRFRRARFFGDLLPLMPKCGSNHLLIIDP